VHRRPQTQGLRLPPAFVEKLVRECSNGGRLTMLTGKPAPDKINGALVEVQPIHGIARDSKAEKVLATHMSRRLPDVGHSR
jgi:hypothetical protein